MIRSPKLETRFLTAAALREAANDVPGAPVLAGNAEYLCEFGKTFGFFADGECFGFFGAFPVLTGVGEGWSLMNHETFIYPVYVRKQALILIREFMSALALHRFQMVANREPVYHERWLKSLGLTCEGVMKAYTWDKKDVTRWALTIQ